MEPAVLAALLWVRDRVEVQRYQRWSLFWYRYCRAVAAGDTLRTTVKGIEFPSPVGAAAGVDPKACHLRTLERLGFGFLELGSITMDREVPQAAALTLDFAARAVTRTSQTATCGAYQYCRNVNREQPSVPLGANLQPSSGVLTTAPYLADNEYTNLLEVVYPYADYIVANIATDAVTDLSQYRSESRLRQLCRELVRSRDYEIGLQSLRDSEAGVKVQRARRLVPPLFVKIDADWTDVDMLVRVLQEEGVDGVVVAGTNSKGEGGEPVAASNLRLLREIYARTRGKLVLIAGGGVFTSQDVLTRIKSGASLVEIYSAFWLFGPSVVKEISTGLEALLRSEGFTTVGAAVGADVNHKGSS